MTIRTIILVRHAEAPHRSRQADIDRDLSDRGIEEAKQLGVFLRSFGDIDIALCSDVKRTKHTLHLALGDAIERDYVPALYQNSCEVVVNLLVSLPNEINSVLIVGHNPSMTDMVDYFHCSGDPEDLAIASDYRYTAKAVVMKCTINDWEDVEFAEHKVEQVFAPKVK